MGSINPMWARAAAAAAIDPTTLSPMELYELFGKLLRDPEVDRLRRNGLQQNGTLLSVEQAIRSMTRYQRIDLKERVAGVIAFPKRKEESNATS
jgi:hypothetical protein